MGIYTQILVAAILECKMMDLHELLMDIEEIILEDTMKRSEIIPDVIDMPPSRVLEVSYGGVLADTGNELTPTQVKDVPNVKWTAEDGAYYLLCMIDPDAPSRIIPVSRELRHWLIGNIPGNDVSQGEILSEYIGAGPPDGTGIHPYVFLVYKQPGYLEYTEKHVDNRTMDTRLFFSIRNFAMKYNLGNPVAGNFFHAQYDDYVPILFAQLGEET